ncbi:hypothetical protein Tsp_15826, partial [Trichinella spiralis]|uniref:hypothetical protein n=1 Tax=Trichinella spiralis TaxID=6334 RepID=UPI0001EFD4B2
SENEENDYDAQGASKEVLPNEEQKLDKEEGIEEASLIIAADLDSKNTNESDPGSSIGAVGMSSTSDVECNSKSGDVGIVENEHLDREKRLGPLKFVDEASESLKGEEVRKGSQEFSFIEAEEVLEKASWSIDIRENSTFDIKVSNSINSIEIFEHKQFDNERFLKPLMPDDDFSQRSSYDSNFIHQHSNFSSTFSSSLASCDIFASVSSSIEDSVIEDKWILIEEKASEGDEDGKHDSTDVRTVEAQYVQEMKVSEEATTMIANCQNEKSAKKANAASEKLGIAEENASDNQNVL